METAFEILPGVIKDDTALAAESRAVDSDKMRCYRGKWQVIGGWEAATTGTFDGIARGAHAWADQSSTKILMFGTAAKLFAYYGGGILDVTPVKAKGTLTNPFVTRNGSAIVAVTHQSHGLKTGDIVTFSNANAGGGVTINGSYAVTILTIDAYSITHGSAATSNVIGGGFVEYEAVLDQGLVDGIGGIGWGTGSYGTGLYGATTTGDIHPRVWSVDNWGSNGLALPENGALYEWQPQTTYPELVTNGNFATATDWFVNVGFLSNPFTTTLGSTTVTVAHTAHGMTSGDTVTLSNSDGDPIVFAGVTINGAYTITVTGVNAYTIVGAPAATSAATGGGLVRVEEAITGGSSNGWNISAGNATATAGKASQIHQDATGVLSGGVTYVLTFTATVTAGAFQFRVRGIDGDIALGETVNKTATYQRRFTSPANPTRIIFAKDATFAGTIDNVSIKVEAKAYRLQDAPPYSKDMFVFNRHVVLIGTTQQNGNYNAMSIRVSDYENNRTWTTNDDNSAREFILSGGSELRSGIISSRQALIWSDTSLFVMRASFSDIFTFDPISTGAGLIAKNAKAEFNGKVFWWGSDNNFYIFEGGVPLALDCPMRKDVTDNLAVNQQAKISCGINSAFGEVWWLYPDARDGTETTRAIIYNWFLNCWYTSAFDRSQWIGNTIFGSPVALGTDGVIYLHERGRTANGGAISWYLETGLFDLQDGDTFMNILRFIPDFEELVGRVYLDLTFYNYSTDDVTGAVTLEMNDAMAKKDLRASGRRMKMRFYGNAGPCFHRHGAHRLDMKPSGSRR